MARRDPQSFSLFLDCDKCMTELPQDERQRMACGFEPPLDLATLRIHAWDHPERVPQEWEAELGEVCPGFACSQPEVLETSYACSFKRDGELGTWLAGELLSPDLRHAITVLESETARRDEWSMKNPVKAEP